METKSTLIKNVKEFDVYGKEISYDNGKKSFIVYSTRINNVYYQVKFIRKCINQPISSGRYRLKVELSKMNIQNTKDGNYVKKILWIKEVIENYKYSQIELDKENEDKMRLLFSDTDENNIFKGGE